MDKRNILLILLAIASSLVVLRACELNQSGDHPHRVPHEREVRVEEPPAPPSPPPAAPDAPVPSHKVVGEDLYDGPDQARVEQILVVDSGTSSGALKALLHEQYVQLVDHAGFQYFDAPTDVTILVYEERHDAANETDDWIARLQMHQGGQPEMEVRR